MTKRETKRTVKEREGFWERGGGQAWLPSVAGRNIRFLRRTEGRVTAATRSLSPGEREEAEGGREETPESYAAGQIMQGARTSVRGMAGLVLKRRPAPVLKQGGRSRPEKGCGGESGERLRPDEDTREVPGVRAFQGDSGAGDPEGVGEFRGDKKRELFLSDAAKRAGKPRAGTKEGVLWIRRPAMDARLKGGRVKGTAKPPSGSTSEAKRAANGSGWSKRRSGSRERGADSFLSRRLFRKRPGARPGKLPGKRPGGKSGKRPGAGCSFSPGARASF